MRRKAFALGVTLGMLAVLPAVPGIAAAAEGPAPRTTPPSIEQVIGEQGSNGFYLSLKVHDRDQLEISASKYAPDLTIETATYKVPYRAGPDSDRIEARFGKLGRVDMRFVAEKRKLFDPPGSHCKGGEIVEEKGSWVGLLAFHGEDGFTQVRVRSAIGTVTKVPPLRCRPEGPGSLKELERALEALEKKSGGKEGEEAEEEAGPEVPPFVLVADARHHRVSFLALRESSGQGKRRSSSSDLIATGTRRRGRIVETGIVLDALAPGSDVRPRDSGEPLLETLLKPADPFSGSAVYRDPPHRAPSFSGDLKVELPGFGTVRLTGAGTHATACESIADPRCRRGLQAQAVPPPARLQAR